MTVAKKILKQVEFYLGDSNLSRDKFLQDELKKSQDRWFDISVIASFQRMKKISEDLAVVAAALKESTVLEVSECGKNVRRKTPLPEGKIDNTPRSVYAKGFDEEATLDDIQAFVEAQLKEGESLRMTRMRRIKGGELANKFKGSVFLEFDSSSTAKRFCGLKLKLADDKDPLLLKMKAIYTEEKKVLYAERKKAKKGGNAEEEKKDGSTKRKAPEEEKEPEMAFDKDLIMKITGLGGECLREDLKAALEEKGCKVQYVEYARGTQEGFCRLSEKSENKATTVAEALKDSEIKGFKPTFAALTGDEETEYWQKVRSSRTGIRTGKGNKRARNRR